MKQTFHFKSTIWKGRKDPILYNKELSKFEHGLASDNSHIII